MPKVAQYDGIQVDKQVVSSPLARARSDVNNMSAIKDLAVANLQAQKRIADTEAEEAITKFEREKNKLFFDPEQGYFNTQGRDAYDSAERIQKDLDTLRKSYSEGLSSDLARQSFDRVSQAHLTRANQDIMAHASKGLNAWEAATINAQVENTLENASLYWNDQKRLSVQRELGRQSVIDAARKEGVSAEVINERLQTYESAFAKNSIEAAIVHGSAEGQQSFDTYKDKLEGPDVVKMQSLIERKKASEKTKEDSRLAVLKAGNLVETYGDNDGARSSIIEEVNKIEDPELRKKTMQESMYQLENKMKADNEERAAIFESGEDFIVKGGSVEQFIAQNTEQWEKLTAKQKRILQTGASIATDHALLSDLLLLPKEELAKVDPNIYVGQLDPSARAKLTTAVRSARNNGTDHQVGRTRAAETTFALEKIFGEKKTWKNEKKDRVNSVYSILDAELASREKQKGAPLSSEEYTKLLNDISRKVIKERDWWFDKERDLNDISAENLDAISEYLKNNNIPVTAENIFKAYDQASGE